VANEEHLAKLREGVESWNAWRETNYGIQPDLYSADINGVRLRGINLSGANLSSTRFQDSDLCGANLSGANLCNAFMSKSYFRGADFSSANLCNAFLDYSDYLTANFSHASLVKTQLYNSALKNTNFSFADLKCADLSFADLCDADLSNANLGDTLLIASQLLGSNLRSAILTGTCIQNWNINSATMLNDVICEYVYLKREFSTLGQKHFLTDRRPSDPNNIFSPGEFTKLFHKVLETVDLIFADGIDWKAFFQSFQELQAQYNDENLSIQAIEKKADGAFVIRLEVSPEADKAEIERRAKGLYERDRRLLEAQYQALLQGKDGQIAVYQEWLKAERKDNTDLTGIVKTMADKDVSKVTQHFHAPSTVAGNVEGDQYINNLQGSTIANFANQLRDNASQNASQFSQTVGQNAEEIARLMMALREQAQEFPEESRDAAQMGLDDLQQDLTTPGKAEPKRIKQRLISLLMVLRVLGSAIATTTDFANNVFELADKFGIPKTELLQYVPTHLLPP
jgi:uncharacterized protein YjbI with pentapeptide repeats